jgi:hypothetical protein
MSINPCDQRKKEKKEKKKNLTATQPPPQPQPHAEKSTIRTALISSFQRYHCHPATATLHATVGISMQTQKN